MLWWNVRRGEWHAMVDACPHRQGALSQGRVAPDGQIVCANHGWAFEGAQGKCVGIPDQPPGQPITVKACGWSLQVLVSRPSRLSAPPCFRRVLSAVSQPARSLVQTTEKQGVVWLYADPYPPDCWWYNTCTNLPDFRAVPTCPALPLDEPRAACVDTFRDVVLSRPPPPPPPRR